MEPVRPAATVACGAFAAAALALGATASLWTDEGDSWATAATSTSYFVDALTGWDTHAPAYFALLRAVSVVGDQALVLRAPSILAGVVAVLLTGRLAEVLAGRRARPVGVLLAATNALLLFHASEARNYALTMALGAASTLVLARAATAPTRGAWARYAAVTTLLVLSHSMAVTVVVAHGLWVALDWHRSGRRPPRAAWAAFGVVAVACLVVAAFLLTANTSETEFEGLSIRTPVVLVREVFGNRSWLPLLPAAAGFLLGASAILPLGPARSATTGSGAGAGAAADGPPVRLLVLLTATVPIVLLLVGSTVSPSSLAGGRYASPVVPAAVAVVAAGVVGLPRRSGVLLLAVTATAGVAAQVQMATTRDFEELDAAMTLVRSPAGEASAVVYFDPYVAWTGAYYLRDVDDDRRPPLLLPDLGFPAPLETNDIPVDELAEAASAGPGLLWLVARPRVAEARADDYRALLATLEDAGYEATSTRRFTGIDVVELRRQPRSSPG
jgi:hypothetical protein